VRPEPADSREGWGRVARAAASYARVRADDLDVYYGSLELRRIATANAKRDLAHAIRHSLEDGASDAWILDALRAGAPSLDAIDAWTELDDARDGPERRAEAMRKLTRDLLGDLGVEAGEEG
jgi:hypothetical protein